MYKPPENTNRVRAIKSKFENNEKETSSSPPTSKNGLSRQHSDPVKVNIKRSPAFRNDKNFQRNGLQISCRAKVGCENNGEAKFDDLRRRFDSQENLASVRPLRERSNTSAEIILRNKKCFDSQENLNKSLRKTSVKNLDIPKEVRYENVAVLYTEPVPKSLRNNLDKSTNDKLNALTDTLKSALKKPLPKGPAPKKPPRTFVHVPERPSTDFEKKLNVSLQKGVEARRRSARGDPKAMLDKLEHALKNHKARLQRRNVVDYTSEEDNCGDASARAPAKFNLSCLACSNEPVYAEPFAHKTDDNKGTVRNSLYYMSTPVTSANEVNLSDGMEDQGLSQSDAGEEMSSLSTPTTTSDLDSLTSTPSEESKPFRIKELIKTFERPSDRVDKLGMQLRRTIERGLDGEAERSSVEGDSSDEFRTYVRTIRMFSRQRRRCDGKHLFHCCLLVGLNGRTPYIKFQFPQNVELPSKIEELCFPDSVDSSVDCSVKAQNYSIVLTDDTGERIYGYCRRVLPENSTTCLPLAYCILSKRRAPRFYRKILEELESRHGVPDKVRDVLLNEFYCHRFPSPGESVRINLTEVNRYTSEITLLDDKRTERNGGGVDLSSYITANGVYGTLNKTKGGDRRNGVVFRNGIITNEYLDDNEMTSVSTPTELLVTLHQDSRYKETDLEELCGTLRLEILQKVFASLLLERKVVFISALLGKLSTCIEAVQNILYPFSWPHTLIPVVPKDLWEIVEAPTPLICGALSLSVVDEYQIEYGIVVDLDKGEVLKEVGDEGKILPGCLVREFKEGMSLAHSSSREDKSAFNVLLSDAFLRIFVHSCGHYRDYIKDGRFQKEEFVQYPKSKSRRRFLKWFTETTMFHAFIETVISDTGSFAVFDKRIQIYSSPDAGLILEKMKDWKREKSNLFF